MKDEGLSADRVAYNALFNALRVAKKPELAYELWGEICGTKEINTTAIATARSDACTGPDIITLTDLLGTLCPENDRERVDKVFEEAVKRGIVLRSELDSNWEIDLSGMSLPVARAACRFLMNRIINASAEHTPLEDMSLITGVGNRDNKQTQPSSPGSSLKRDSEISLRDYVRDVLQADFQPPISSFIPKRAPGTVQIDKSQLIRWLEHQKNLCNN
jgi:hypothetical protein